LLGLPGRIIASECGMSPSLFKPVSLGRLERTGAVDSL
jgi:hypothetical protein